VISETKDFYYLILSKRDALTKNQFQIRNRLLKTKCIQMNHLATNETLNKLSSEIIGSAIEVHREMGPGLLESVYEICLARELAERGIDFKRQVKIPVKYKTLQLDLDFRIDLLVEEEVVVEIKTVEMVLPIREAQLLTYLKLSKKKLGLIINFNQALLKDGIKRMVNGY